MQGIAIIFISFVFVLGVMILVHEFGHFAAAKLFRVRVETFALGFGKRLIGFRKGETDYCIRALPFGGYVKMAGENPMDPRSGSADEFTSHPRWQRLIISLAGPFMNIVLSVALLTGVYIVGFPEPAFLGQKARVAYLVPGSPADKAGVMKGDTIVKIEGTENPTWEDMILKVSISPGHPVNFTVLRDGKLLPKSLVPEKSADGTGMPAGWSPYPPNVVGSVEPGMPAEKAGLKAGDIVVAVNGRQVNSPQEMIDELQQVKDTSVPVTFERNGIAQTVALTPVLDKNEKGQPVYRIGTRSGEPTQIRKLAFFPALEKSFQENRRYSLLVFDLVKKMLRKEVSIRTMSGPIDIARASGEAASQPGWTPLLFLMAIISLQLGIFNLFPIPILDGGVILMLLIEGLMRRDISVQIKERVYQVAFVFLVLFAAVVIYNDILKALAGHRLP